MSVKSHERALSASRPPVAGISSSFCIQAAESGEGNCLFMVGETLALTNALRSGVKEEIEIL